MMWRARAVVSMLLEDIAGLEILGPDTGPVGKEITPPEEETLSRAIRRARLVVAVDSLAILILFLFRDSSRPFLPANQTIETVFTLSVLAVAGHAGFRLAQGEILRSIQRLCRDLRQRDEG